MEIEKGPSASSWTGGTSRVGEQAEESYLHNVCLLYNLNRYENAVE